MTTRHLPSVKWYSACIEEAFYVHLSQDDILILVTIYLPTKTSVYSACHENLTEVNTTGCIKTGQKDKQLFFVLFGWDFLSPHNCIISLGINEVFYFWYWWRGTDLPAEAPVWPWTSCQQPSNVQWTDTWEGGEQVKFKCGLKHYKKCSQYIFLPELRMTLLQQTFMVIFKCG